MRSTAERDCAMPATSDAAGPTATTAGIRAPTRSRKSWAIADRALLGGLGIAGGREDAVGDVADERDRRPGADGRQMHGQRIGEALLVGDEQLLGARGRLGLRVPDERGADDHHALPAESQARERVPCAEAALERRADELGREPALHVGARADAQQVQGDELRGIPQSCRPLRGERTVHRGPHRPEHLVAGAHADRDALRGDALGVQDDGIDDDRPVIAVQVAEDAALGQDAGVPLGHLPADDRLGAGGVGLLLAAREREHARRAVLDRDRRVQQRGDRVGDGEEVARRQAADRLALGVADVAVGEERAQERGELRPGRTAREAEQRDAGRRRSRRAASSSSSTGARTTRATAPSSDSVATSGAMPSASTPTPRTSARGGYAGSSRAS